MKIIGAGRKESWIMEESDRMVVEWTTGRAMSVERFRAMHFTEGGI